MKRPRRDRPLASYKQRTLYDILATLRKVKRELEQRYEEMPGHIRSIGAVIEMYETEQSEEQPRHEDAKEEEPR